MKLLKWYVSLVCVAAVGLAPAFALAPQTGIVNLGPFDVSLNNFVIVDLFQEGKTETTLTLEQKETGDIWRLKFDQVFNLPSQPAGEEIFLPVPKEAGFDLLGLPGSESNHPLIEELTPQKELISWIPVSQKASHLSSLVYEWKVKVWKAQATARYERSIYEGKLLVAEPRTFEEHIGERKLFQIKMKGKPFLEGNGVWGLPVKSDTIWGLPVERRFNGEEILFIYKTWPGELEYQNPNIKLPDQIGVKQNGDLILHQLTTFENIEGRMEFLNLRLTDRKEASTLTPSKRRSYRRQLSRLREIHRVEFIEKIQKLESLKKELLRRLDGYSQDHEWHTKVRDPNHPQDEKEISDLIYKIHRIQRHLAYDAARKIQNQIFELELDELRNRDDRNGSLVVRNDYGDEVAYSVLGNETSPYPPIIIFSGWKGVQNDPFFKQLQATEEGRNLLRLFRFLVVTLPVYPHRDGDETHEVFSSKHVSPKNYFLRAAKSIEPILREEGVSSAFVLGSRFGAIVAGEAAKMYWAKDQNRNGSEDPVKLEGVILFDPALYNPSLGVDIDIADFFPGLKSNAKFLMYLRSLANGLFNYNPAHFIWRRLKANTRGLKHFSDLIYRRIKGVVQGAEEVLSQQEIQARLEAYFSLLSQTKFQMHERISALKLGPSLVLLRNRSLEGRALKRALSNGERASVKLNDYFDDADRQELNMHVLYYSLMKIVEDNYLSKEHPAPVSPRLTVPLLLETAI